MTRRSTFAAGAFAVVFALGGVTGAELSRVLARRRAFQLDVPPAAARRETFLAPIDAFVKPTPGERAQLARIYDEQMGASTALLREIEPRFAPMRVRMHDDMRAALAEERRAAFDRVIATSEDRYAKFIQVR